MPCESKVFLLVRAPREAEQTKFANANFLQKSYKMGLYRPKSTHLYHKPALPVFLCTVGFFYLVDRGMGNIVRLLTFYSVFDILTPKF